MDGTRYSGWIFYGNYFRGHIYAGVKGTMNSRKIEALGFAMKVEGIKPKILLFRSYSIYKRNLSKFSYFFVQ